MIKNRQNLGGFTLVEILVVCSIVVILSWAIASFGRDIFYQNFVLSRELVAEGEAKVAMRRLIYELRTAEPSNNGSYSIESASRSNLVFFSDINNDGKRERLRYFLDGKILKRGQIYPTGIPYVYSSSTESFSTIINDIINPGNLIFSYYDRSYDGTSSSTPLAEPIDVKSIRLVKVEFLIDANSSQAPIPIYMSSQVMIRNLKDNL
jgi:type II secretory pathway pseudopilin PulG